MVAGFFPSSFFNQSRSCAAARLSRRDCRAKTDRTWNIKTVGETKKDDKGATWNMHFARRRLGFKVTQYHKNTCICIKKREAKATDPGDAAQSLQE